jgi:RHH-type proline utilization regulon transcriptional repressor/proline dehydrogenase/delta 1-pyrroline-5-carboxylate dehydrogenase
MNHTSGDFLKNCEKIHCANEIALSNQLYSQYAPLPQANKIHLTEINQKIEGQHDWFFDILQQYRLNSKEGMLLMSLAEALIRIPDQQGAQALFYDRLHRGQWLNKDCQHSLLAKALEWLSHHAPMEESARNNLFNKITQHGAIEICSLFIEQMSQRFVFAQDLDDALLRSRKLEKHEACSFDMLGEAALTYDEADHYFQQYHLAIEKVGQYNQRINDTPHEVSIKLSALHPRYQPEKFSILVAELLPKLNELCLLAKRNKVKLTLDAEEQYRLELSIKLLQKLLANNVSENKHSANRISHIGLAVQAYSKSSLSVIDELKSLSQQYDCEITVRLVKGAYWDYEIKSAQQLGLKDYPVWSKKQLTDDCYLMCAKALLATKDGEKISAQFASHNPETLLQLQKLHNENTPTDSSADKKQFLRLQRLHGMGELQHAYMANNFASQSRVYCPIGSYQTLLPYLVRRLIENGANSSFLYAHRNEANINELTHQQAKIDKPENILDYPNSLSHDIRHDYYFTPLYQKVKQTYQSSQIKLKSVHQIHQAAQHAQVGLHTMANSEERIKCLYLWADHIEEHKSQLIRLLIQIAGKTYQDAIDEIREACDFCRYYAGLAKGLFSQNQQRPSITGEVNQLSYQGKGIAVCISPWNFPLAIFVGQIAAAWVTGNAVIAKPAQQTLDIAQHAIKLAYQAGIDKDQLQLLHCQGKDLIPALLEYQAVQLVCFTGSSKSAKQIQQTLANNPGPIIPFIAETGGQNVLIADSSALIDQLVPDVVQSAFYSAGQRCSALRVAYIQADIFNDFCRTLKGHMDTLIVGDPIERETDVGPIIDKQAIEKLQQHQRWLDQHGRKIGQCRVNLDEAIDNTLAQRLFAPCAYQIQSIKQIKEEHFGPILHVIPFQQEELQQLLTDINQSGYGLTMGLHSRNQDWLDHIICQVNIGNIYINRNMVGAKVSSQPFGGHGLSGTGPKAGGPNYLNAMVDEYLVTTNITAWGGNPELL